MPASIAQMFVRGSKSGIEDLIPQKIKDDIGVPGWNVLSWGLHHEWVQTAKYFLNYNAHRDAAGVPEAVKSLASDIRHYYRSEIYKSEISHVYQSQRRFSSSSEITEDSQILDAIQRYMVIGYLLGTDFVSPMRARQPNGRVAQSGTVPDEHGLNQLEGELKRFWARERGVKDTVAIGTLRINPLVLEQYCDRYGLADEYQRFAGKLGLIKQ